MGKIQYQYITNFQELTIGVLKIDAKIGTLMISKFTILGKKNVNKRFYLFIYWLT